jgi:SNF2 family DNA or RNA helicase
MNKLTFPGAHAYQEQAMEFALNHPFSGLLMEMGLGKTVVTLTLLKHLMYDQFEVRKVLIVAPLRVAKLTWPSELKKWPHLSGLTTSLILGTEKQRLEALSRQADIYIINRDNFPWLVGITQKSPTARRTTWPFDTVVLDELSSFKNHRSLRFKMFRLIRPQCSRIIGLTGTPVPNGYLDLWAQIFCLDGGKTLGKTLTSYRLAHFDPAERKGPVVYSWALRKGQEAVIAKKLEQTCLTLRAKDHIDVPEFVHNSIYVEMPLSAAKQYNQFERDQILALKESGEEVTAMTAAALRTKLLQFANGAIYVNDDGTPATKDARKWEEMHEAKLDALADILEDAQGQPVFVAWAFRHDRERIMKRFKGYAPKEFDGKNDEAIRDAWNEGKIELLIAHPASVAHGLNLQDGGHIIVWFGLPDSLELYQQFNARLQRQGQKQQGVFHYIITKGTEDENQLPRMQRKDNTQDDFLERLKEKMKKY